MKLFARKSTTALASLLLAFGGSLIAAAQDVQTPTTPAPQNGALGTYYNIPANSAIPPLPNIGSPIVPNSTITTQVAQQVDATIDMGDTQSVNPAAQTDDWFTITWLGTITCPSTGNYKFRINVDDGGRLWVSKTLPFGAPVVDSWIDQGPTNHDSGDIALNAGDIVYFRFEFYEHGGGSASRLHWQPPGAAAFAAIPTFNGTDTGMRTPGPCPTSTLSAASVGGATQIRLDWVDPGATAPAQTRADSYNIYRGTAPGGVKVWIGNTTGNTFTDTGAVGGALTFGTTYYYVVQGVFSAGVQAGAATQAPRGVVFGAPSNEVGCAVNPFAITPASQLIVEAGGVGTITITTSAAIPVGTTVTFPITNGAPFTVPASVTMTGDGTVGQSVQVNVIGNSNNRANDPRTANIQFGPSQSANAGFNNHTFPPVVCTEIESDIAGVIINPANGLAITNGGPAIQFQVSLATIPDFDVTMTLGSTLPYAAVISPATITFTAGSTGPITITVTPNLNDTTTTYLTSFYVTFQPVTSLDANYNGINPGSAYIFMPTSTPPLSEVWGSGGCGLLGLEGILIMGLIAGLRRRRAA